MDNTISGEPEILASPSRLPEPAIASGWLRVLLFLLASGPVLLLVGVVGLVAALVLGLSMADIEPIITDSSLAMDDPFLVLLQALVVLASLFLVMVFRRWVDRRSFVSLGFQFNQEHRRHLLAGLAWGAGLIVAMFAVGWALDMIHIRYLETPRPVMLTIGFVMVIMVFQEELICRGYMLSNLMASSNRWVALAVVSVLFTLAHVFNPNVTWLSLLNIALAGVLLGIYYVHRQNLWFPMGLHLGWNFVQGVILGVPVSGIPLQSIVVVDITGPGWLSGGEFGFEGSILASLACIAGIVALHLKYRRSALPFPQEQRPVATDHSLSGSS